MSEEKKEFTYEMLMEAFREIREIQKKSAEESRREIAEIRRIQKANAKQIGGIDKSLGDVAEEFIFNALEKDMTFGGIKFDDIDRNMKLHSKFLNLKGEFDVVLENGDTLAIIETKHKVRSEDISKLIGKPDNFRKLFPKYSNYKVILGVGGLSFEKDVVEDAENHEIGIINNN